MYKFKHYQFKYICVYLWPAAVDDVIGGVIDLALHLNRLLLVLCHFDTQDPEVWPPKIQSYEVPLFCQNENTDKC